jgi:hypothetical protein
MADTDNIAAQNDKGKRIFDGFVNQSSLGMIVSTPITSLIDAQVVANNRYLEYINKVMLDDQGQARSLTFHYNSANGVENNVSKTVTVPIMAVLTHPCLGVETADVEFYVEVKDSQEDNLNTETKVSGALSFPIMGSVSGSITTTDDRKRKTDTTATMKFNTKISRIPMAESMSKVIDALMA